MKRRKLNRSKSMKSFKRGMKTNTKNFRPMPSRGGYRL